MISRRSVLRGVGQAAALGAVAAALPRVVPAQEAGESAICLSMVYPNPAGAHFDQAAFMSGYLPLLKSTCGDGIERIELRLPQPYPPPPAGPLPSQVLAAVGIWIRDLKAFQSRSAAAAPRLNAQLAKATSLQPALQFDQVLALLGDARSTIPVDGEVLSVYFPTRADGKFDAQYYGDRIIPMMVALYGADTIRRIEFTLGARTASGVPVLQGSAHYYIRDRAAFDAAGTKASPQLAAEAPKYTNITPMSVDMKVVAIG